MPTPVACQLLLADLVLFSDAMKERGLAPGGFPSDARVAHIQP
jgi:hypothetical protein